MAEAVESGTDGAALQSNPAESDASNGEHPSDIRWQPDANAGQGNMGSDEEKEEVTKGTSMRNNMESILDDPVFKGTSEKEDESQRVQIEKNIAGNCKGLAQNNTNREQISPQKNKLESMISPRMSLRIAKKKLCTDQRNNYHRLNYSTPGITKECRDNVKVELPARKAETITKMDTSIIEIMKDFVEGINDEDALKQREEPVKRVINDDSNKQNSLKRDDFVIVIEPQNSVSHAASPGVNSPAATELEKKNSEGASEKSGIEIQTVYSLHNKVAGHWSDEQKEASMVGDVGSETAAHVDISSMDTFDIPPLIIQPDDLAPTPSLLNSCQNEKATLHVENSAVESRKSASQVMLRTRDHNWVIRSCDRLAPLRHLNDVIVTENNTDVIWVQEGHMLLPNPEAKVMTSKVTPKEHTGSKVIGSLHTLITQLGKMPCFPASGSPYTCPRCRMSFSMHSDWLKHREQCLGELSENSLLYYCNRCPYSFARHRDWVAHRKSHAVMPAKWMCDRCYRKFRSRRDLRDHRLHCTGNLGLVSNKPKFQCEICSKSFPYPSALKVHSETHILKHKCPICDQPFTRFYEMTKHVRMQHPDVEAHSCETCGNVFDRLTMLYRHKSDGQCTPKKL